METIPLGEFVQKIGQARVARALHVKPASIAKALKTRRNITVSIADDGSCTAQETRPFPCQESSRPIQDIEGQAKTLSPT
ncbi:Cro/CI family transcriptional regulator [Pseudomonas sp. p1(2021b)]|uniref:Cro/CI family transcriptional regulator n=1 Tax=Pseudomonas sp. p1(2021b) TaxID=2874628 RepID=UPI001CCA4D66|nr:Cro/CI family transcriptional regulator [Pseudomonas sp. p1(2021b)]UBM24219.1 Cro/CI family transcriptional regulator [Pseudomonas sp. p1(2021b)]